MTTLPQSRSSRGWLVRVDPRLKLLWLLAGSLVSVVVESPLALLVAAVVEALPLAGLRLSRRGWVGIGLLLALGAWSAVFSQALFYVFEPRTPLFSVGPIVVWREGALYGLIQSLRFLGTTGAGLAVALSTPPQRLLAALAWLRLPSGVSFMTITALRSLPVLADEWRRVRQGLWLRGYRPAWWGPPGRRLESYRVELSAWLPLLAGLLRRSSTLATSVTVRGFDPAAPRTHYPPLKMRALERAAVVAIVAVCVIVVIGKVWLWRAL